MNFKSVLVFLSGLIAFLFGSSADINKGLTWLVILMAFQVVTTMVDGTQDKIKVRETVIRCVINLMFIAFSHFVQLYMNVQIELIVISGFWMSEGYSVIANFIKLGVPVPAQIKSIFGSDISGK